VSQRPMVAFAGNGDATADNITALLNDWLGYTDNGDEKFAEPEIKPEVFFILPDGTVGPGLDKVIDWSSLAHQELCVLHTQGSNMDPDLLADIDKRLAVDDTVDTAVAMLSRSSEKGFDPYLVVLWDEGGEPSEMEDLLEAAAQAGIPTKSLLDGLDDVSITPDEPEADDEPEPEPSTKAQRRRREKAEPVEELTEDEEELTEDHRITVDEAVADAEAEELPHDRGATSYSGANGPLIPADVEQEIRAIARGVAMEAVADAISASLAGIVEILGYRLEVAGAPQTAQEPEVVEEDAPEPPKPSSKGGRPRADGSPAVPKDEQPVAFVRDEDGVLTKKGRGRPRKGSEIVMLTLAEAVGQGWEA
jgi:hypothetical protein